jgi:hypothetical protein
MASRASLAAAPREASDPPASKLLDGHPDRRYLWLKLVLALGLASGFLLSSKTWVSTRFFPLTSGIISWGEPTESTSSQAAEDTGHLEAQIRDLCRAWDIRLLSIDTLRCSS